LVVFVDFLSDSVLDNLLLLLVQVGVELGQGKVSGR